MDFSTEIGDGERHQLRVTFDQTFGKVEVQVDGKNVALDWRWFSLHRTRRYEFTVGREETHDVLIELTRKAVVGGFRSQTCRVHIDGVLVESYVGSVTGRTTRVA